MTNISAIPKVQPDETISQADFQAKHDLFSSLGLTATSSQMTT